MRTRPSPASIPRAPFHGALALIMILCAMLAMPANAASTAFFGPLLTVFEDDGTGAFAGSTTGTPFAGEITYGDSAAEAFEITIEPNEAGFEFLGFFASLSDGTTVITGSETFITIQDNFRLDEDEAELASLLLGETVAPGTLADSWAASAIQAGAFETDPNPNDGDDEELLFNGVLFDVIYFSLDTDLIDSTAYDPIPPGLDEVDLAIYQILEGDSEGNVIFAAVGQVESTVIPVPAAAWLFGSAIGLLGFLRRVSQR